MNIVYIDAQNVHRSTQDLGWKVDWSKLNIYFQKKLWLTKLKIFFWYVPKYEYLYSELRSFGYEVIFKETLILPNGEIKGNVDIDIAISVLLDLFESWLDRAYLVTWDGDYNTLVDLLRIRKKFGRVYVPHPKKASKLLKKSAGPHVQNLEELRYLIEKRAPLSWDSGRSEG